MNSIVSTLGLESLVRSVGLGHLSDNFELLYSELLSKPGAHAARFELEQAVRAYFSSLQLPDEVTLYDKLLLSLREKDVIATFNWDPLLLQASYRLRHVRRQPRILFLHGNVSLGYCAKHRITDFLATPCRECKAPLTPSPILFPVTKKDYNADPFVAAAWHALSESLAHAFIYTVFGYSAPATDVEAVGLMTGAWTKNEVAEFAETEIVDVKRRKALRATWDRFIVRSHYGVHRNVSHTISFRYPRRACEGLGWAILQSDPWPTRPFPRLRNLDRLIDWVKPLIDEEDAFFSHGTPLSRNAV